MAATRGGSVLGSAATSMARVLSSYGVDGREVARSAGVPDVVFTDRDARVASDTLDRFAAMAAEASGDPAFALRYAQEHRPVSYHLYFAMAASDSLADAWRRAQRFRLMVSERFSAQRLAGPDDEVRLTFCVPEPAVGRWIPTDVMSAMHVLSSRAFTLDPGLSPRRMELRRPRPDVMEPYEALFRCPMSFGCERTLIVWAPADARRSLPLANPAMAAQAEGVIADYMAKLDLQSVTGSLSQLVSNMLPDGLPKRDVIARRMGLSPSSLARALAAEGTTYRNVVNEVRRTLACSYLQQGASVTEIAFMLGFSETSAFTRAFRRWTGRPPTAYAAQEAS